MEAHSWTEGCYHGVALSNYLVGLLTAHWQWTRLKVQTAKVKFMNFCSVPSICHFNHLMICQDIR